MSKIWKSDGKESKYLEKLFREKNLNANSKPAAAQKKYPLFDGFSAAVFRKNFAFAKDKCCPNRKYFQSLIFMSRSMFMKTLRFLSCNIW